MWGLVVLTVGLCAFGLPRTASAEVEGTNPTKVDSWRLFGAHSATGAALMGSSTPPT